MLALMGHLDRQGRYLTPYCNREAAQAAREDIAQTMQDILREMSRKAQSDLQDAFAERTPENLTPGHCFLTLA